MTRIPRNQALEPAREGTDEYVSYRPFSGLTGTLPPHVCSTHVKKERGV